MWALVGDKQRFRLWKHGTANCVGLVRETASDLVALKWLRRRRRRNIIDTHHSVAGRKDGRRSKRMSRLSCHIHRNFASLFTNGKNREPPMPPHARWPWRRKEGKKEGRREERQNCTKIPISRRRSPSRLACVPTSSPRLRRRERRRERASDRGKERGLKGLETALASRGLDSLAGRKPYSFSISFSPRPPRPPIPC